MAQKPQPLNSEQAKEIVAQAMAELGQPAGFTERIKLSLLIEHLYNKKNAILVLWRKDNG